MKQSLNSDKNYFFPTTSMPFECFQCCHSSKTQFTFLYQKPYPRCQQNSIRKIHNSPKISLKKFAKPKIHQVNLSEKPNPPIPTQKPTLQQTNVQQNIRQWKSSQRHKKRLSLPDFVSPKKFKVNLENSPEKKKIVESIVIQPSYKSQKSLQTLKTKQSTSTFETNLPRKGPIYPHPQSSLQQKYSQVTLMNTMCKQGQQNQRQFPVSSQFNGNLFNMFSQNDLFGRFSIREAVSEGDEDQKISDQFSEVYKSPQFSATFGTRPEKEFKFEKLQRKLTEPVFKKLKIE